MGIAFTGPLLGQGPVCAPILRGLPQWFGIEEATRQYIRDIDNMPTLLAWADGSIAGFLTINRHNAFAAEIHVMGIRQDMHRQGIGRALLARAELVLRQGGVEFLQVKTLSPDHPDKGYARTRRFYAAMGFRPLQEFSELWGKENPCLQMVKTLTNNTMGKPDTHHAWVRQYMQLFYTRQRYQWQNYAQAMHLDLNSLDRDMYRLAGRYAAQQGGSRWAAVGRALTLRDRVDRHPAVARLRNRLDDRDNYTRDAAEAKRLGRWGFRLALARRMRRDVTELMAVRERLAREMGFPSYVELVLFTEDMVRQRLHGFLQAYVSTHLPLAQRLVKRYGLTWPTWFSGLTGIGSLPGMATQPRSLLRHLGLEWLLDTIHICEKEQRIAGCVAVLSPEDVRILVRPVSCLNSWLTLFHELGHATAHAANLETGLFATWTTAHDETMAAILERVAADLLLDESNLQAARELHVLETVRCALSALFELALWQQPERAESLYSRYYGRLCPVKDPDVWAADTFRSIDPVYIHTYVVAHAAAEKTIAHLDRSFGQDAKSWGSWLLRHYYMDGRRRTLRQKTEAVGFHI